MYDTAQTILQRMVILKTVVLRAQGVSVRTAQGAGDFIVSGAGNVAVAALSGRAVGMNASVTMTKTVIYVPAP